MMSGCSLDALTHTGLECQNRSGCAVNRNEISVNSYAYLCSQCRRLNVFISFKNEWLDDSHYTSHRSLLLHIGS